MPVLPSALEGFSLCFWVERSSRWQFAWQAVSLWHAAKQQSHVRSWEVIHRAASQESEIKKNEQKKKNNNGILVPLRHFHHIFVSWGVFTLWYVFLSFITGSLLSSLFISSLLSSSFPCSFFFSSSPGRPSSFSTVPVNLMSALPARPHHCETNRSERRRGKEGKRRGEAQTESRKKEKGKNGKQVN